MNRLKNLIVKHKKESIFAAVILAVILAAVIISAVGKAVPRKMLVKNDFSKGLGNFTEDAYADGVTDFAWEKTGGIDDSACVRITNNEKNDSRYIVTVNTKENAYYRFSVWTRSENIGDEGAGANISVIGLHTRCAEITGSDGEWRKLEFYGKTASGQTSVVFALRLGFYSADNTGTVWFDNAEVEQLSKAPSGVNVITLGKDQKSGVRDKLSGTKLTIANKYYDTMLVGYIITFIGLVYLVIMYRYFNRGEKTGENTGDDTDSGKTFAAYAIVLIAAAFVVRLIVSVAAPQCNIDVALFQSWGNHCAEDGILNFYKNAENYSLDYPPLYIYFLWFNAKLAKFLGVQGTVWYNMLVKLPSILADCAIGYIIFREGRKHFTDSKTIFFMMLWLFNPLVILDSAAWGQVDSLLTLPLVLTVLFITKDKYIPASVCLGLSIILKPQGIFMVPVMGYALIRRFFKDKEHSKGNTAVLTVKCVGAALATVFAAALPFGIKMKPDFFSWLFNLYLNTTNGYKGITVNSYNFWYVLGENWTNDSEKWLSGMSFFKWGMLFIVLICVISWILYHRSGEGSSAPFLISAFLIYGVTMFGPRMHERYFFPCVALLLFGAMYAEKDKHLLAMYGGISAVNFLSVLSIMMGLNVGGELNSAGAGSDIYGSFYWAGDGLHKDNWYGAGADGLHRNYIAFANLFMFLVFAAFVIYVCVMAARANNKDKKRRKVK